MIVTAACGSSPSAPAPSPTPTPLNPALSAPAPRTPAAGQQLDTDRPTLTVTNAAVTGTVGTVTYEFEVSETDTFPAGSRTQTAKGIPQGGDGATSWTPPTSLIPNLVHFWRARAAGSSVGNPSDWSRTETFKTLNKGFIIAGQKIYDPLTDGSSVGTRLGGRFIAGQGWQADQLSDGLFYDFGDCTSCTLEFDVTNFGRAQGALFEKDLKWVTMGNAATFGDFVGFRDHPWKMHLEQRSDGDGTGMKLIWRNGDGGGGNPGDHERRNDSTVSWTSSVVYRFTLRWTPSSFSVSVGTVGTDGQVTGNRTWFDGSFGGLAYAPPLLRISLGCSPRAETLAGAIWRNVHITRN